MYVAGADCLQGSRCTVPAGESAIANWAAYLVLDVVMCQGCLLLDVVSWRGLQSSSDTRGC